MCTQISRHTFLFQYIDEIIWIVQLILFIEQMGGNNQTISNPQPEVRRIDPPKRVNPRLSGYVQFKVNDQIIDFIQVKQTRLYFKAYNVQQTVKTLQDQYRLFHNKKMKLENEVIQISPNMPLSQIVTSTASRKVFEEIVTKIDKDQKVNIKDISADKKEIFQTIVSKCNEFYRYEGKIHMNIGPKGPMKLGLDVKQDTTFNEIISMLNDYPQVVGNDIQFEDDQGQAIDQNLYDVPFDELKVTSSFFNARFSCRNSLVRAGTFISVFGVQGNELMIERFEDHRKINLMSYDAVKNRVAFNDLTNFKKEKVSKYIQVTLSPKFQLTEKQKSKEIVLEATGSYRVCVLNRDLEYVWLPVARLKSYPYLGIVGIDKEQQKIVLYDVKRVENKYLKIPQFFYGLESLPSHQYIANSIIVHNSDSCTILAYNINNGQKQKVRFQRHQKLSQRIPDKICEVGGHILNKNQTFGDYHLDQIPTMIIYDKDKKILENIQRTYSEWKNPAIKYKRLDGKQKLLEDRLREYFGIYQNKIIPFSEIMKIQETNRIVNIFVAYRVHFQRMYYYMNIQSNYQKFEADAYQNYKTHQNQCKLLLKNKKQTISKLGLNDKQVLAIYIYTTNVMYTKMNEYLRDDYRNNVNNGFLGQTGWISKSLSKTKRYRGKVFRGVPNIDLQTAFGLGGEQKKSFIHSCQIKGMQLNNQKTIINFTYFTSTSKNLNAALRFANRGGKKKPSIWTLQIQNGHIIQQFSQYPQEEQILILPFTYFVLHSYDTSEYPHRAFLQEIPMPKGSLDKIVFWVDDNPQNNDAFIENFLQPNGIEVVQVISTRIMEIIMSSFFVFFKLLGKKIVIISDMVRMEEGKKNEKAGIDLCWQIYNHYGLSNKAIIYTMDKRRAIQAIKKTNITNDNWVVIVDQIDLYKEVMLEFQKM